MTRHQPSAIVSACHPPANLPGARLLAIPIKSAATNLSMMANPSLLLAHFSKGKHRNTTVERTWRRHKLSGISHHCRPAGRSCPPVQPQSP
jgi:hypothetical protein